MLYDKRWDKTEVKADPFSLESLIAWLEKQPSDEAYVYTCNGHCLLAQYFTAMGYQRVSMYTKGFDHAGGYANLPRHFNNIAIDDLSEEDEERPLDRTFGGALTRARAIRR